MGTLGELKARILDELPDGLSVRQIGQHITRAIDHYASEQFWFNLTSGATTTTSGQQAANLPAGLRRENRAYIAVAAAQYDLCKASYAEILDMAAGATTTGQPTDYAIRDGQMVLHPTPNAAYTITMPGLYDEAALPSDASANAWTTEAADLIAHRARKTLYRDLLKDAAAAVACQSAEDDALYRLRAETTLRLSPGRMRAA